MMAALSKGLAPVLYDLARTYQGLVMAETGADELLLRLRQEFVARMMGELEPWGEDGDLRETVVELLTRHLLAEAREGFVRRVVVAKRN